MSIYSRIFEAHAGGNSVLGVELERERKQLAENGSLALAVHQDPENPNTAAGRKEKERRNAADTMSTRLAALMADPEYRAAYEALSQTIEDSREKLDDWNSRIEERLDDINRKLAEDEDLSAAERERLDQERLELLRRQQEIFDLHALINDTDDKAKRGEFEDKDALDEARKEIEERINALESNLSADVTRTRDVAEPEGVAEMTRDTTLPALGG